MLRHYGRIVRTLLANDLGSIAHFGSPFSSKAVVCRHCPVILLLKIHEALKKTALIVADHNAGVILADVKESL